MKTRLVLFVSYCLITLFASIACSGPKRNPSEQSSVVEMQAQLKKVKRGDIILFKDSSMCCITFSNKESYRCKRYLDATEETFLKADDHATSNVKDVIGISYGKLLYPNIASLYLQQASPK